MDYLQIAFLEALSGEAWPFYCAITDDTIVIENNKKYTNLIIIKTFNFNFLSAYLKLVARITQKLLILLNF